MPCPGLLYGTEGPRVSTEGRTGVNLRGRSKWIALLDVFKWGYGQSLLFTVFFSISRSLEVSFVELLVFLNIFLLHFVF